MSECIYCGLNSYGESCIYSPTKFHMHMDEPDKCIYCGSKSSGNGCIYNPYGTMHVKGSAIYNSVKENLEKVTILSYLAEKLSSENDLTYKSPLDRFYKRLCDIIKKNGEPILEALAIQNKPVISDLTTEQMNYAVDIKNRLGDQLDDLKKTIKYANSTFPPEIVEKIIVDVIISKSDNIK
jgi:hypothetical protein